MNLRTVKQLATLRAQAGPLRRQAAERIATSMEQAKADVIAQFKSHFTRGGFTVTGESRRYAASFEGMQFILGVADSRHVDAICEFSIVPPAAIGETKQTVAMVRKHALALSSGTNAEDLILTAEQELAEARTALAESSVQFVFKLVKPEESESGLVDAIGPDAIVFNSFGEFLSERYPE